MPQVLIVSNRLPVSVKKVDGKLEFYPSLGGLATGLSSYVKDRSNIWVGWPGIASEELTEQDKLSITRELAKHHCNPVFLTRRQIDDFYNGYSNGLLWPIFHSMPVKQQGDLTKWWKTYKTVNKLFADTVLSLARSDSTIWVHDYQLLLMPQMLRAEHAGGHIGFFLHIPFPEPRRFAKIEHAKEIVIGMLGADLVGFHTTSYSEEFLRNCQHLGIGIPGDKQLILPARSVQVTKFPIGVDYEKYAQAGKLKGVKDAIKRYRYKYGRRRKLIVAVDRLEPSKGLVERLKAYREFLASNPKFQKKVTMVMVAAPSRMDLKEYQQLKVRLEKLSDEINAEFGTASWLPVDFINEPLPFEEVTALYQLADVAFIAPLIDGMNLVAKEYVAAKGKNGVLILSQTAGAAEELRDALLVDPSKPATVVEALQRSLTMPRKELKQRFRSMKQQIAGNTIQNWAGGFVSALQKPVPGTQRVHTVKNQLLRRIVAEFRYAGKRVLLLDYDGSLVPFTGNYKDAAPPRQLLELLTKLCENPRNDVVLISGRQPSDLDKWFSLMPMNLVAEHGAAIKKAGSKTWDEIEYINADWKESILPILEKYTELTPGATIEVKPHSIVWHYRSASPYYAQKYGVIIKRVLKPILKKSGVQLYQGNKILELKDPRINKGAAVQPWLEQHYDFMLAIGDDYTDEDLFEALGPWDAHTIKVGNGHTSAKYRLKNSHDVVNLLKRLSRY